MRHGVSCVVLLVTVCFLSRENSACDAIFDAVVLYTQNKVKRRFQSKVQRTAARGRAIDGRDSSTVSSGPGGITRRLMVHRTHAVALIRSSTTCSIHATARLPPASHALTTDLRRSQGSRALKKKKAVARAFTLLCRAARTWLP